IGCRPDRPICWTRSVLLVNRDRWRRAWLRRQAIGCWHSPRAILRAFRRTLLVRLHSRSDNHELVENVEPEGRAKRDRDSSKDPSELSPGHVAKEQLPAQPGLPPGYL